MQGNRWIVVAALASFGAVAYAAAPASRPVPPALARALALRSQYNPFALRRQPVEVPHAVALAMARVAAVRPPYRPEERSPYQPPTRGPYITGVPAN